MPDTPGLPALPRNQDGPVFHEPWEARAFALAVSLAEAGCFTWPEWAAALSDEIRAAQQRGDADLGNTYYHHWLNALERLCARKGLVAAAAREQRQDEWRRAYHNTLHGQPIELAAAFRDHGDSAPQPLRD
jgi:nitrile hydratase accessory protein